MIRTLFDNLTYKLVALLFAIILWAFVTSTDKTTVSVTLPVHFVDVPEGVIVVSDVDYVEAQVAGPSSIISGRQFQRSRLEIPVEPKPLGYETVVSLGTEYLEVPFGVEVLSIKPSVARYHLDPVTVVEATVVPSLLGEVARGYKITRISVSPAAVRLRVAQEDADRYATVRTTAIDIHQIGQTRRIHTSLLLPPSVQWEPVDIVVTVEVAKETTSP
ncbi:CdaR family protein [Desulfurispira natronophila]|uniref:YbbR domain-containing protein n=1 Tax=Desulfurispira natronophila TaxID=682562 RepID=A0A7W8DHB0_9BACT|nr:YbbR-like domain-containing protein [Desulfurispira natronophila]MBB5022305.1 YbbR domain-containing protein [Desulfurispira natronophila]